ncbi:MAG: hypothetical protein ACRDJC_24750, partial [Thermomicrobiales bacterium]
MVLSVLEPEAETLDTRRDVVLGPLADDAGTTVLWERSHEPEIPAREPAAPAPEPMTQRRVLSLATPIIGENLLQTLVGAVDTFMVA